jgi:hypothetical protein
VGAGDLGCGENSNETTCSCKRQGIERVAELLASWEGLSSMTLIVINCSDFGSYN